jgi:hypothetical protein
MRYLRHVIAAVLGTAVLFSGTPVGAMKIRKTAFLQWIAAGILSFGMVAHAHAVLIPDQVFDSPSLVNFGLPSTPSTHFQQGVTAGLSGLLSRIDIFFAGTPPVGVGTPPGEVLFTVNLGAPWQDDANDFDRVLFFDAGQAPGVVEIDVSAANIFIEPGDMFVIGLQSSGSNAVIPNFTGALLDDHYTGGALWLDEALLFIGTSDLNFVTYVAAGLSVPEPSGLVLLFLGLPLLRLTGTRRP